MSLWRLRPALILLETNKKKSNKRKRTLVRNILRILSYSLKLNYSNLVSNISFFNTWIKRLLICPNYYYILYIWNSIKCSINCFVLHVIYWRARGEVFCRNYEKVVKNVFGLIEPLNWVRKKSFSKKYTCLPTFRII